MNIVYPEVDNLVYISLLLLVPTYYLRVFITIQPSNYQSLRNLTFCEPEINFFNHKNLFQSLNFKGTIVAPIMEVKLSAKEMILLFLLLYITSMLQYTRLTLE